MRRSASLLIIVIFCSFFSSNALAGWKAGWGKIVGIGFSTSDSTQHVKVNIKWVHPPGGISAGTVTETIVLESNVAEQTMNRLFATLLAAKHARNNCYLWFDDSSKIHRNRYKLGDVFCEKQ